MNGLRCYAKREGGVWVAVCIDFSLAAQSGSLQHARAKLGEQILSYIQDAGGRHSAQGGVLLTRKSRIGDILMFHVATLADRFHALTGRPARERRIMSWRHIGVDTQI